MRRLTRFSILMALAGLLSVVPLVPAHAETAAHTEHPVWRLVDESEFSGALPEGFEPMEVPASLIRESTTGTRSDRENVAPSPMFHICSPLGHAENPHVSGSDVSAHGFWERNDCNNHHANVRVDLAAFWGDRRTGLGTWITITSNTQNIEPGGGRGNRVTSRAHCYSSSSPVSWRNTTDVDVVGENDWHGKQENIQSLQCAPTA